MKPIDLIRSDLYRYAGAANAGALVRKFVSSEGFNYSVWFRLASSRPRGILGVVLRIILRRKQRQFGIVIPPGTAIGPGLFIGHFGNIVINETAVIGANCNLSQGVTIGSNHGQAATIGDNVYIGPNVCIVENVVIGDSVTIGAGSVVTADVPSNVTVAGVPARVMSDDLARNRQGRYVLRRWTA
ncbi:MULTISPECIES: DapH/DapD/GlmU-related protein [unclassified Caballeronia]|uniref:serine O-acetyltransferase n=1 Tax=unclassified Caballeronia TaxID=2646786 RepID=UPI002860C7BD|nr:MULTISPECIES: DapH/DapD/GlmU-related protein [unclassified Caballeronia]MDR5740286.1 DapH/DapD/GlmU-related protein [Caballeronia sp. LZ016]MDR5808534.1 DapH/DapD/GlmU-related protein [Caballeronia sp. LZ019]